MLLLFFCVYGLINISNISLPVICPHRSDLSGSGPVRCGFSDWCSARLPAGSSRPHHPHHGLQRAGLHRPRWVRPGWKQVKGQINEMTEQTILTLIVSVDIFRHVFTCLQRNTVRVNTMWFLMFWVFENLKNNSDISFQEQHPCYTGLVVLSHFRWIIF